MSFGNSINLESCRFCLKMSDKMFKIDSSIKNNFYELMHEEVGSCYIIYLFFNHSFL